MVFQERVLGILYSGLVMFKDCWVESKINTVITDSGWLGESSQLALIWLTFWPIEANTESLCTNISTTA